MPAWRRDGIGDRIGDVGGKQDFQPAPPFGELGAPGTVAHSIAEFSADEVGFDVLDPNAAWTELRAQVAAR